MKDSRIIQLANNLVNYSCDLKEGEKVLIEGIGDCLDLVKELVKETYKAILELSRQGKAIDFVTVLNQVTSNGSYSRAEMKKLLLQENFTMSQKLKK